MDWMGKRNIYDDIYQVLVNRVPVIQKQYHKLSETKNGMSGRIYAWAALLWMNFCWLCGDRRLVRKMYWPDERKRAVKDKAESENLNIKDVQELAGQLLAADVISFDIFDTLIFRPVKEPSDLFFSLRKSCISWISSGFVKRRNGMPDKSNIKGTEVTR